MTTKTKTLLAAGTGLLVGALIGLGLGYTTRPTRDGAYFCCDAKGENCVLSPDGDCTFPIQWCSKTAKEDDGTVYCAEW